MVRKTEIAYIGTNKGWSAVEGGQLTVESILRVTVGREIDCRRMAGHGKHD